MIQLSLLISFKLNGIRYIENLIMLKTRSQILLWDDGRQLLWDGSFETVALGQSLWDGGSGMISLR